MLGFIIFCLVLLCILGAIIDGDPFFLFILIIELLDD